MPHPRNLATTTLLPAGSVLAALLALSTSGCSGSMTGARTGSGGASGSTATGGATATGGTSSGGSATGGRGSGGVSGTGGSSGGTATGGATSSGGSSSGGAPGSGGSSGTGGMPGHDDAGAGGQDGGVDAGGGDAPADGGVTPPAGAPAAPPYNGWRGQSFNAGWTFNRGDVTGAEKTSFDDSKWRALDVPHDWSIELAFNGSSPAGSSGYLDGGVGWYRKTFTLDASASGKSILIEFDGVYMNSQVWINGTSLGTRPYGYSTFEYDLTPYVKTDGTANVIAVRVNNNQPNSRWYSGSGIYRNVWLTQLGAVRIPNGGVFWSTPTISGTSATVSVSTDVQNQGTAAAMATVTSTILDAAGAVVATNDSAATAVAMGATATTVQQMLMVQSPQLWSVNAPYLYQLKVEVKVGGAVVDTYRTSLGVRTAMFDANTGFSLNGQAMKLQGVCMHHDLGALGSAFNYRALERQVQILKSMGVNAIRTSHNPPAPELLEIADRLGVLVMEEAFDTWTQPKTTNDYAMYFNDWAQRDVQDMVRRDRNHPSVIMWSIGNEIYSATTTLAKNLKGWVQALDSTRPVTWASNQMSGPHYDPAHHDIAALLDLAGYNYAGYAGDYDADHTAHPTWKLFGSETTAAVRSRGIYHTPAGTVTKSSSGSSADKQCSSYDNETMAFGDTAEVSYARDASRPFVAGSFIWSGFDYIGEPSPYGYPAKSSYFGIVDTAGFPKDVYYFYKSRWTSDPMVHLLPHWNWTSGTNVTVYAYDNCDSVELFLNDKSLGSKSHTGSALHTEWSVPWASGTLRAACTRGGSVVAMDTMATAGSAAKVVLTVDRSTITADGKDLAFITADVQDANGVLVPTADNSITFAVSGPGALVGVDNGNPIDDSSYKGTSRKAFSGKALAIVRSNVASGTITITATASGLTSAPVTVTAD